MHAEPLDTEDESFNAENMLQQSILKYIKNNRWK
jgi:hypothetical protein